MRNLLSGAVLSVLGVVAVVSNQKFLVSTQWKYRLSSEQSIESKDHRKRHARKQSIRGSLLSPTNENDECSGSWGTFVRNETLLTETQFIRRTNAPPPVSIDSVEKIKALLKDLFIDPNHNFAFCGIAKNAVSQWKTVLRNVYENRTSLGFEGPDYNLHRASQKKHGVEQVKQILESPDSTVVVMVRDPLARFVSAYLGKCFARNCKNAACLARRQDQYGNPISFRQALEWIQSPNVSVANMNIHWKLQSERCGISDGSLDRYFTIIGKMTKETLSKDADCILKHAGLERFNISPNSVGNTSATFWNAGGTPNLSYRKETEEHVLRKLFTPKSARLLMTKFQQDYDIFQLPEPPWISHATGEWMDSLDHHACRS